MTEESKKLDIFELLGHVDAKDVQFYASLDEEAKKGFVPLVAMQWAASKGGDQLLLLNDLMNTTMFKTGYKYPALMYKLMVAASDGKKGNYSWVGVKKKDKSLPNITQLIMEYHSCSERDARFYIPRFEDADILEMADDLAYDKEQIKKIKAELKK
jgi:hypothetical protein